ncbi:MAG TPA: hypothetical protein VGX03_16900 [Candidatus Binatia bacterium]|nr:hypothetical protein [Candidatus Binatia bacterium]
MKSGKPKDLLLLSSAGHSGVGNTKRGHSAGSNSAGQEQGELT